MMLGARTAAWSGKPLPYKREVKCLISSSKQLIDTGFKPTSSSVLDVKIKSTTNNISKLLCGIDTGKQFCIYATNIHTVDIKAGGSRITRNFRENSVIRYRISDGVCSGDIDGTVFNFSIPESISNYSFILFGGIHGYRSYSSCAIYYFRAEKTDQEIDLIPVIDLSGRPCFFDKIKDTLIYNSGTGEFGWEELDGRVVQPI